MAVYIIQSKLENLKAVRDWLGKTLLDFGVNPRTRHAIITATNEIVTNIIVHTYREDPGGKVGVEVDYQGNTVEIRICDFRPGFRINLKSSTDSESGFGLRIVKSLMDEFFHFHDEKGNNFVLRKHVPTRVRSR